MLTTGMSIKQVIRHPYRTAQAQTIMLETEYSSDPEWEKFEKTLADQCNKSVDNHTVYEIHHENGQVLYIQFSDWRVRIGMSILVKDW